MSEPVSLAGRRWDRSDGSPSSHSVEEMLQAALAKLASGEIEADHAILIMATEADGCGEDRYMQAGAFGPFAQLGLICRAQALMLRED